MQELARKAEGRFVIGDGSYNPRAEILLVPDASVDGRARPIAGVRRFARERDGTLRPLSTIPIDDVLPPRQVMPL